MTEDAARKAGDPETEINKARLKCRAFRFAWDQIRRSQDCMRVTKVSVEMPY